MSTVQARVRVGRYVIFDELAAGGMAAVHLGRLLGSAGFVRTVAIKRLHAHFAKDPDFVAMFTDEARLAARIRHPNVAATLDVVSADRELFLVMEYIHGESLSKLLRTTSKRDEQVPLAVAVGIGAGVLHGLHAAHEATTDRGDALGVVHRDVSPQNVMVGQDGIARVVDFGVAKAVGRLQTTRDGEVKGKTAYMAPEQLRGNLVDRRADVYAAAVVLWETLTGHRLFAGDSPGEVVMQVLTAEVAPPSRYRSDLPPALDALVLRGLAREPETRFATALAFATALEAAVAPPSPRDVGLWVERTAGEMLAERAAQIAAIERCDVAGLRAETLPTTFKPTPLLGAAPATKTQAEPVSQVSSISMTTPMKSGPRRRLGPAALAPAGVLVAAVAMTLVWRSVRHPAMGPSPESTSVAPAEALSLAAPTPAPTPGSTTSSSAAVSSSSGSASPAATPPPSTRVRAPAVRTTTKSAPKSSARGKATPRCDPPYTVDADGIHIPKAECE